MNLYGILFALGLVAACYYVWYRWRDDGGSEKRYNLFIIIEFVSIFLGARLCHCLCYEPHYYLHHIAEMLLPIAQTPDGSWHLTAYHGLASHGGAIGAIAGIGIYRLITHHNISKILDWCAIATPLLGTFIRIGNFTNQEIVGRSTSLPWGVVFDQIDSTPRHPAQLYEAAFYLTTFVVAAMLYKRYSYTHVRPIFYFGAVMTVVALFRIGIEYLKEPQVAAETGMTLNIGQLLSIPPAIIGATISIIAATRKSDKTKNADV